MSVRRLLAATTATLLGGLCLAAPAAAYASSQPVAADVYAFTLGRIGSAGGALVGLAGLVIAWLALTRPAGRLGTANGPLGAVTATVAGLISLALGVLVAATADGGLGTGNGLGGAYVAILVGLTATTLGGTAMARRRRTD
ncbi:DUF6223 family protein [Streptomyces sp. NPDC006482]|uniref:DUF6223 family protein n=1 Tax=Streptomyces sp. NPDC006482 TaxID=3154306 RepID=UPI0033AB13F6